MPNTSEALNRDLAKVAFIYKHLDACYYFKDEDISDHARRCFLRFFFVLIDDLLKVVPKTKNQLNASNQIDREQKTHLESAISQLRGTFDRAYDLIRDKLSAHQQPIEFMDILRWWTEIDITTIETFYNEAHDIRSIFKSAGRDIFVPIRDYSKIDIPTHLDISKGPAPFQISAGRLASAKPNTIFSVPCHVSQEKIQIVVSLIEFLDIEFAVTSLLNGPETEYKRTLFDIAWWLIIIDCCSLMDNLYSDTTYDKSLINYWQEAGMKGLPLLEECNRSRNVELEQQIRSVRNHVGAHVDAHNDIQTVYGEYEALDLRKIHEYVYYHINSFRSACRSDERTRMFLIVNSKQDGILGLEFPTGKPFDN